MKKTTSNFFTITSFPLSYLESVLKKFQFLVLFPLFIVVFYNTTGHAQCTNGGYDGYTHVPTYSVNEQLLSTTTTTGTYTKVEILAQRYYTFLTAQPNLSGGYIGYITITNESGTVVHAHGTAPLQWYSGNNTGMVRFYLHNSDNCSGGSSILRRTSIISSTTQCALPTGFSISNLQSNSVTLHWNAPSSSPSAGYQYMLSLDTYVPSQSVATIPTGYSFNTSVTHNVSPNRTYWWWVRSSCGTTASAWVRGGTFVTPAVTCNMPSGLIVSDITSTSASISWQHASPIPTFYDYAIAFNSGGPYGNAAQATGNNQFISELSPNTTYHYWVRSVCAGGSVTSQWVYGGSFTTLSGFNCNSTFYPPNPETNFTPACTQNFETVSTTARAGQFSRINILQNREYTFMSSIATDYITITNSTGDVLYAAGQTPLTWLSNANSGYIRYYLHSSSSCGLQFGDRTKYVKCNILGPSCMPPSSLFATDITTVGAKLAWNAAPQTPVNGYQYYYSTTSSTPASSVNPTGSTMNTFANTPLLSSNTTYYFWVRSNCGDYQSSWISGGSFTTLAASGCTEAIHELYPNYTYNPLCTGGIELITDLAWAGEYSEVNVFSGNQYVFRSSVASDFITITNDTGTVIYGSGTSPFTWYSNSFSGKIRYYFHTNSSCGNESSARNKWVSCSQATLTEATFEKETFKIYPNPVVDIMTISYSEQIDKIEIINISGQLIIQQKIGSYKGAVDFSALPAGMYILKAYASDKQDVFKVIKK